MPAVKSKPGKTIKQRRFEDLVGEIIDRSSDDLLTILERKHFFTDEDDEQARRHYRKFQIGMHIRAMKDDEGHPRFASVKVRYGEGRVARVYRQEAQFKVDDYVDRVRLCRRLGRRYRTLARWYESRGRERFGKRFDQRLNEE